MPKAVWGYNGTERPGAVYLAAVLAGHNQKGLPAFSIYGHDVQDAGDGSIPADAQEKLAPLRPGRPRCRHHARQELPFARRRLDGIAGSIVDQSFFEDYLGMRVECVDMSELTRRIEEKIYDEKEFKKALHGRGKIAWKAEIGIPPQKQRDAARKDWEWETVVKMTLIARDLMHGNPRLAKLGFGEEALGHNAIVSGFQGQRQWTDISRTATSWRRSSTRRSTGTASVHPSSWPPRTTRSTARACSWAICSRTRRRFSPTCAPTGVPTRSSASPAPS